MTTSTQQDGDLVERLRAESSRVVDVLRDGITLSETFPATPTMREAADEIERLWSALEKIASCQSHHPDDVVAIARAALSQARGGE